jgi:5-methylthioribose kinase
MQAVVELDIEKPEQLLAYLRRTGRLAAEERPTIRPLTGGVSNRTVLVECEGGESWVLKQALSKLRVADDWFSDPARIHREALGMRWLAELAPPGAVPAFLWEDRRCHLLAMRAVPQPHANWKELLLREDTGLEHARAFGRLLGVIHRSAWERRSELRPLFDDLSFFESLRVEPYYRFTAERVPEVLGFVTELIDSMQRSRLTLVHGDYSPKNILVREGRLVLLDHEVIHFGDPAFDIGFSMAHLLSKAHHRVPLRSAFAAAARDHWEAYLEAVDVVPWKHGLEGRAGRHILACLLARVAGRSALEYLSDEERRRQRRAVLTLMRGVPLSVPELIREWIEHLEELDALP